MSLRLLAPLVLTLLAAALLAQCSSGGSTCTATSCQAGCCDSSGACVAGDNINACGSAGSGACGVCSVGRQCINHACVSSNTGGGGGAGTGGGSAAGGGSGGLGGGSSQACPPDGGDAVCAGGAGVCINGVCVLGDGGSGGGGGQAFTGFHCSTTRTLATFSGPVVDAGYDLFNWVALASPAPSAVGPGGTWDVLDIELNQGLQSTMPVPGVSDLDGGDHVGDPITYFSCGVCPLFFEACDGGGFCARTYLGVSGHVDVARADQFFPGAAYVTMSNVTLVEWDLTNDKPVADSGCVQVGAATFDAGW